jgi:hypothetical protein
VTVLQSFSLCLEAVRESIRGLAAFKNSIVDLEVLVMAFQFDLKSETFSQRKRS